jgi:hypothetical protein
MTAYWVRKMKRGEEEDKEVGKAEVEFATLTKECKDPGPEEQAFQD